MAPRDQSPADAPVISFDPFDRFAGFHLLAALAWPESERDRGHALVKWTASLQAAIEVGESNLEAAQMAQDFVWRQMGIPAGGYAANRDAPALDTMEAHLFGRAMFEGMIAGRALCLAATMAHEHSEVPVSMNRVWSVMRADLKSGGPKMPEDVAQLKAIWKEWRCIAPLYAAMLVWFAWADTSSDPGDLQRRMHNTGGIGCLVGWAKWFRVWATGFRPARSPGALPIIPETVAVRYDAMVEPSRPPLHLCRLSPARLASAKAHRAATTKHSE